MLFFITGANGAGKTACLPHLARLLPECSVQDFAGLGVPPNPDARWRQETTELWIRTYVEKHQPQGEHLAVSGEAIFGEILCCPSFDRADVIRACLLDCDDMTRVERLRLRGTHEPNMPMLCWAAYLRVHAVDPNWCPEVIQTGEPSIKHWERWNLRRRGDAIWKQEVIDTSHLIVEEVAAEIARWVRTKLDGKLDG
ncbi:MAG: hypothetical protein FJW26_05165 [Acidimicrobiia bacterium]|nr:hypothetical protein [Acidimicrobiia bacterium]